MKAPVPPAQLPFMRMSGDFPSAKKIIFESSPPMSMKVETCGKRCFTSSAEATTSWMKGIPLRSA